MTFIYILLAGLLGVVGHWLTRWTAGRTQSSFWDYLMLYKGRTISSIFSIIGSSALIYQSAPDDVAGKALFSLVISAYATGYMLDSTVNKDKLPPVTKEVKDKVNEDKSKSLRDILDYDARL